jgi:hypothetical protein
MAKIDLRKQLGTLYFPSSKQVEEVIVPPLRYLMIDGKGDPNTSIEYRQAVEALFSVSYATKFALKRGPEKIDYSVMPLEGLWWADAMSAFINDDKANWKWTLMIHQPEFAGDELIQCAIGAVGKKRELPALTKLRLEELHEGRCAQIMHVGPFSAEGPTIRRVHEYIDAQTAKVGKHHEIYLSDIRRASPKNWKTIIRQPMK